MSDNVKVAVRVRPFNSREKGMKAKCIIRMDQSTKQTLITDPESGKEREFTFDFSYNSFVARDHKDYASQDIVYRDLGHGVLENAYDGYNTSLFAYGQTGSGKSYSMVGYGEDKGIIPIASEKIFDRVNANEDPNLSFKVESSMLEIYMEKVRDLFNPKAGELKIRLDPKKGFFVQGLTKNTVGDYETVEALMEAGTKARTVAATNMNATSSRAHTIFQLTLTQTRVDAAAGKATDKTSTINLIDLAGSERANSTGATGARLKEGSAINLSLTALGNVISALAANSSASKKKQKKVPYRDSALTMLLQNSLGGNAKTIMIAAISPADVNHDETLSTLRYADRAKQIKNKAVVNEDPNEKLIRNLKSEVEQLRKLLAGQGIVPGDAAAAASAGGGDIEQLRKQMEEERETEIARMRKELEDKMRQEISSTQQTDLAEGRDVAAARMAELKAQGVLTGKALTEARERAKTEPHLVNLHEDPQMSGQIYYFPAKDGTTTVGRSDAGTKQDIVLGGLSIQAEHAVITGSGSGTFTLGLQTDGARTHVNGDPVKADTPLELHHNARIVFGNNHAFHFVNPEEVAAGTAPEDPDAPEEITFDFAIQELNKAQVAAIAAEEEKRRKAAEEERAKAEARVKELQESMEAERKRMEEEAQERMRKMQEDAQAGDREARERQEAMLEEARKAQAALEKKLQAQIAETERVAAKKQKEMRERSLLDEKLLKTIPLVNESNAIADELEKGLILELRLMANQRKSLWTGEADEDGDVAPEPLDTEVYVRVAPKDGEGLEGLWHYDDFMDRLYAMRELYQAFVNNGRTVPVPGYEDPQTDPFLVEPEDMAIGKATVFLDTLLHIMPISETTPILDYKGSEMGELIVRVVPHFGEKVPETDEEADDDLMGLVEGDEDIPDSLSKLVGRKLRITIIIDSARGLPVERSVGAHVRYAFFLDERQKHTPAIDGKSMNPKFHYRCTFENVVTDELLKYFEEQELVFEVWGRQDDGTAKLATAPAKRFARASMMEGDDAAGAAGSPSLLRDELRAKEQEAEEALSQLKAEEAKREALEARIAALEAVGGGGDAKAALDTLAAKQKAEHEAELAQVHQKLEKAEEEKEAVRRKLDEAIERAEHALGASGSGDAAAAAAAGGPGADEVQRMKSELQQAKEAVAAAETARVAAEEARKKAEEELAKAPKKSRTCAVM